MSISIPRAALAGAGSGRARQQQQEREEPIAAASAESIEMLTRWDGVCGFIAETKPPAAPLKSPPCTGPRMAVDANLYTLSGGDWHRVKRDWRVKRIHVGRYIATRKVVGMLMLFALLACHAAPVMRLARTGSNVWEVVVSDSAVPAALSDLFASTNVMSTNWVQLAPQRRENVTRFYYVTNAQQQFFRLHIYPIAK